METAKKILTHAIIHTASVVDGALNLVPIPGSGLAFDLAVSHTMKKGLEAVHGSSVGNKSSETVRAYGPAKELAKLAVKQAGKKAGKEVAKQGAKQFFKQATKEGAKAVPGANIAVAAASAGMIEADGWNMVKNLRKKTQEKDTGMDGKKV